MFLFWKQHASLTLTDGVAISEFFTLIWQADHLRSLSHGTVRKAASVTHYQPSMATSCGTDRTLMKHLLAYGARVASPFWSTWFIIHLCSFQEWAVISRFNSRDFSTVLILFSSNGIELWWTVFTQYNNVNLWNRLNSEDSDLFSPTIISCIILVSS